MHKTPLKDFNLYILGIEKIIYTEAVYPNVGQYSHHRNALQQMLVKQVATSKITTPLTDAFTSHTDKRMRAIQPRSRTVV